MNIDLGIFIIFLICNVVLGLYSSRGIKSIKEYAIGNRNFSTATIAAAIIASWLAGSNFSITVTETYKNGLYYIIPGLADGISFFILAYFYAPRMAEFLGNLSVAEAMGNLYGKEVRIITSVSAVIIGIGNIAIQFSILTILLYSFLGLSSIYAMLASCLIIIVYSAAGGIKAITFTNMIQFFTFSFVMPITAFLIWQSFGNTDAVSNLLSESPLFNLKEFFSFNNKDLLSTFLLFLFFVIPGLDPVIFQRIAMARNTTQVSNAFKIAGFGMIFIEYGIMAFIGVLLLAYGVDINIDNPEISILKLIPAGFKGLFVVGMIAMVMSTADSYINSSSVLIVNDLCKSIGLKLSERTSLISVRLAACLVGICALILSLSAKNLLELILSTYSFYMPIVSVPLILAIFGFRSTSKIIIIGMTFGFMTVISFKLLNTELNSVIPGMIANLLIIFVSHYLLKSEGGWIGIKDNQPLIKLKTEQQENIQKFKIALRNFNFISLFTKNIPQEERTYVYFGLFCVIFILTSIYSFPIDLNNRYYSVLTFIYCSILILATIFITYPIWLQKFKHKNFISILWVLSICYCLVFSGSLLAMLSNANSSQLTIMMANLVTAAVLINWYISLIVITSGALFSIEFYKWYTKLAYLPSTNEGLQFKIIYALLLISSVLITFLRPKQKIYQIAQEKVDHLNTRIDYKQQELGKALSLKDEFLRNISHEVRTPMVGITSLGPVLYEMYDSLSSDKIKSYVKDIADNSKRLESLMFNILDLSTLSSLSAKLDLKLVNISELVRERTEVCKKLYTYDRDLYFTLDIENNLIINCDEYYIKQTLDNLIINAINYGKQGNITITLKGIRSNDNKHTNFTDIEFSIQDEGIGVPEGDRYSIFESFTVSSRTHTLTGGRGVGLALCKKVIDLHKGRIWAQSRGEKGAVFSFIIPR